MAPIHTLGQKTIPSILRSLANAPVPLQTEVSSRSASFTAPVPLRVAVGTYNINSGKYFRTPNYEGLTVADWLDCYKEKNTPALLDLDFGTDTKKVG